MPFVQGFIICAIALSGLFILPGLCATLLLFRKSDLDILERVPVGLGISLGLFLLVFLPAVVFSWDWAAVQWIWIIIALSLVLGWAAFWFLKNREPRAPVRLQFGISIAVVSVLFLVLAVSAALTLFTPRDEDDWTYYQIVRGFADAPRFGPVSIDSLRYGLNLWWFFHAFIIRTFNLDIVYLGRDYLPFLLVPLSLLAFYALARALSLNRNLAVLACVLQLSFFVIDLFYNDPNVQLTGGWVLGRIDQDHTATQFLLLPIYAASIVRYMREGDLRWLGSSFVVLLAVSTVHPQGFVQAGILVVTFLAIQILFARRRQDWKRIGLLSIPYALVLIGFIPFILYWSNNGQAPRFNPVDLVSDQSAFPVTFRWITFLSPAQYVLRPDLLTSPAVLAAFLLTPWLLFSLRSDLGARYLFGVMIGLGIFLYVPMPFGLLFGQIGWGIYRFWYLFPSVLVLSYFAPHIAHVISDGVMQVRHGAVDRRALGALFCVAGFALVASRFPVYVRGAPSELGVSHSLPNGAYELFAALRELSAPSGGVVLAPIEISNPIPSYRLSLTPVAFRYYTPRERLDDVAVFYATKLLTSESIGILDKYKPIYLIVSTDNEVVSQIDLSVGYFTTLYRNAYWVLYRVNLPLEENALVRANTLYIAGDLQGAIDQYNLALSQNLNGSLAHTGLGMVLQVLDKPRLAAQELEEAIRIAPNNVQAHYHLASVYRKMGMDQQADVHAAAAGSLMEQPK